ncbi:MAG TPA: transposase [Isosphaeraceae bacterium]|nr:transposase [Isosphaeraceae bacterium]
MPTVADVLRRYGPAYLERFGSTMPREHKKVLAAITACRTGQLGGVVYQCESCGATHTMGRSCGNRHCPGCQKDKTKAWLENQLERLLPCPYFLITFTVPAGLREFVRRHQRIAYAAMFEASSAAIKTLAADPKFVGTARCGFFGVLHTWGRTLEYHPHVHYVVPGGGLSDDGTEWLPSRADFFVPVRALSILFRAKFRDALDRAGLLIEVDGAVWRQDWVVHSQAVGDGRTSLQYLAPYVFRVAISDRRIVSCEDGRVTFSYRKSGSRRWRTMTVDATEFIRRFLQHVLPSGFPKVRHYGFLSGSSGASIAAIRWLIALFYGLAHRLHADPIRAPADAVPIRCPVCSGPMRVLTFLSREAAFFDTS